MHKQINSIPEESNEETCSLLRAYQLLYFFSHELQKEEQNTHIREQREVQLKELL